LCSRSTRPSAFREKRSGSGGTILQFLCLARFPQPQRLCFTSLNESIMFLDSGAVREKRRLHLAECDLRLLARSAICFCHVIGPE
jgi:hypothetical protein